MSTSIGIRRGGVNMSTCNVIYWTIVLPTLCFGCEVWFIKQKDIDVLLAFQRYTARHIQRLHPQSLNITSITCLGWMSIVNYIQARKLIFLRTIICMEEYFPLRKVFIECLKEFTFEQVNLRDSPILQMLQYSKDFGLLDHIQEMSAGNMISKTEWIKLVWLKAWDFESAEWHDHMLANPKLDMIRLVSPVPSYLVWWSLSDSNHKYMRRCEIMVKLLCHASLLKYDVDSKTYLLEQRCVSSAIMHRTKMRDIWSCNANITKPTEKVC